MYDNTPPLLHSLEQKAIILSLVKKDRYPCHMLPQNQSQQNTENIGVAVPVLLPFH